MSALSFYRPDNERSLVSRSDIPREWPLPASVLRPSDFSRALLAGVPAASPSTGSMALDVGSGSGVIAEHLCALGYRHVLAIDSNADAVKATRQTLSTTHRSASISVVEADFAEVRGEGFELVALNPPTLPDVSWARSRNQIDLAFLSGPEGRTFLDLVINSLTTLLAPSGRFIFVHPAYLDLDRTTRLLSTGGFRCRILRTVWLSTAAFAARMESYGLAGEPLLRFAMARSGATSSASAFQHRSEHFALHVLEATHASSYRGAVSYSL